VDVQRTCLPRPLKGCGITYQVVADLGPGEGGGEVDFGARRVQGGTGEK
jgi:hypothetical protein